MTSPKPEVGVPVYYGTPLRLRVVGPGWKYQNARKIADKVFHSEWWAPLKDGTCENRLVVRKNKRDYPILPPIVIPRSG